MASFKERFNELISKRGEMARLSEATAISTGLLSNYKNGNNEPSFPNAILIAEYFDVSLDWLAGRDGYARDAHKGGERPPLSADEAELVSLYRDCTPRERNALRVTASTMADGGMAKNDEDRRAEAAGA